jgi:hypothetical protein
VEVELREVELHSLLLLMFCGCCVFLVPMKAFVLHRATGYMCFKDMISKIVLFWCLAACSSCGGTQDGGGRRSYCLWA